MNKTIIDEKRKKRLELEAQRESSWIKTELFREEAWNRSNISAEQRLEYLKETPNYELLEELKRRLINGEIEVDEYAGYPIHLRADKDYYLDIPHVLNNECGEFGGGWEGECVDEYEDEGSERGERI